MVMRLDLECDSEAVADVDDAGVLAGALQDGRAFRRQPPQMNTRTLVAAVLAPHNTEDAELCEVRFAPEDVDDLAVFGFGQSMLRELIFCNGHYFCPKP